MRVVVLGAGYAGVVLTRTLERRLPDEVELVLVNDRPYHLVQHELHRLIRRPGLLEDVTVPLDDIVTDADVRIERVASVEPPDRLVHFEDGSSLTYDVAAICLGAETAFHGLSGVREHATPLKRVEHAATIREGFEELLDVGGGRVIVGGAGLSGVQVAGELAEFSRERDGSVTVTLLEQLDDVAPSFPANFQRAVRRALERVGVDVRTGATITDATDDHVELGDDSTIEYDQFVWTGGIRGVEAVDGDRPQVHGDLRHDERTFVVGDAARVVDANGEPVPASAQAAVREARVAARNVARTVDQLRGERDDASFEARMEQFGFDSPGWVVSVGDDTVAQVGPAVVTGFAARALKVGIGAGYLSSVGAIGNAVDLVTDEMLPWRGGR